MTPHNFPVEILNLWYWLGLTTHREYESLKLYLYIVAWVPKTSLRLWRRTDLWNTKTYPIVFFLNSQHRQRPNLCFSSKGNSRDSQARQLEKGNSSLNRSQSSLNEITEWNLLDLFLHTHKFKSIVYFHESYLNNPHMDLFKHLWHMSHKHIVIRDMWEHRIWSVSSLYMSVVFSTGPFAQSTSNRTHQSHRRGFAALIKDTSHLNHCYQSL